MSDTVKLVTSPCPECDSVAILTVLKEDYEKYQDGEFVQNAFPYLSTDDRERLVTKLCGPCFDKLVPE